MMQKITKRTLTSLKSLPDNAPVVVSFARTPIGNFGGSLSSLTAPRLAAHTIEAAIARAGIDKKYIQEAFLGNVVSAGIGQAPTRQAVIYSGLPLDTPSTTVNKVCASGMKAVMFAAMSVSSGYRNALVAGGMESMSNIPYYLPNARTGYRIGDQKVVDGMIFDGLWDIYNNQSMGNCGEVCAKKFGFTRKEQDDFSIRSNERAVEAWSSGKFEWEVAPISVEVKKKTTVISKDETIANFDREKIPSLKPAFAKDGTVTAASSSKNGDGASTMIVVSAKLARDLNLTPLFLIRGYGDAAKDPVEFTTAPADAIPRAAAHAGVAVKDIEYHEINEAFAVVPMANAKLLNLDLNRVNVFGGAVSIGHPIGSSGSRIIGTLYNVLKNNNGTIGCASICNGGGGASAIVIERLS